MTPHPLKKRTPWLHLLIAGLAFALTACASTPPDMPEDAMPRAMTSTLSAAPATLETTESSANPIAAFSPPVRPWDLVAPAQINSAQSVSFTQVSPGFRKVPRPESPGVTMLVTRSSPGGGQLMVSRKRSDQPAPMSASLARASDGAVTLQRITISENTTLESRSDDPLIWLPADLEALRLRQTPLVQRAKAILTRDGKITENAVVIRIRAIGNNLLPIRPAPPEVVGVEWDLTIDAGASIRVRIETWYRPVDGILFDARTITAKLGPLNLFDRREAWIRTDYLTAPQNP